MEELSRYSIEELDEGLRERLRPRIDRLGYLGEFFQVAAHQPAALGGFIDFTEALKDALPAREVEVIALTIASRTGNSYERVQHERLALWVGFDEGEVEALERGNVTAADGFSERECAISDLAQSVAAAGGKGCPNAFREVRRLTDDSSAVGLLLMCARYLAHASLANTWRLQPPVASIFDVGEDADRG